MDLDAMFFMGISWGLVLLLSGYCMYRVLTSDDGGPDGDSR